MTEAEQPSTLDRAVRRAAPWVQADPVVRVAVRVAPGVLVDRADQVDRVGAHRLDGAGPGDDIPLAGARASSVSTRSRSSTTRTSAACVATSRTGPRSSPVARRAPVPAISALFRWL